MDLNDFFLPSIKIKEEEEEESGQKTEIRFGAICPKCKQGRFDYDGLLNLVCPKCGFTSAGCLT